MDDSDSDGEDSSDFGDEHDEDEETDGCQTKKTAKEFDVLPNVSAVNIKE